jgi:ubiquinone/menaquinone biosynthesis C-methylase UbiE
MPFDHFNLIAGLYDRSGPFIPGKPLLECLSLSSKHRLLDAGGGTGRVTAALKSMVRAVVVVDISTGMLRSAAAKGLPTVASPAEVLPFPSGSFDRVIMLDALHHVSDQLRTVSELWRVLAPGGRIVIVEPDIHKAAVILIAGFEKLLLMRSHFLSGEKIKELFVDPLARVAIQYADNNILLLAEK